MLGALALSAVRMSQKSILTHSDILYSLDRISFELLPPANNLSLHNVISYRQKLQVIHRRHILTRQCKIYLHEIIYYAHEVIFYPERVIERIPLDCWISE